ncbi:efflux RND transporter permease subunit [Lacinutrix jangbogonensis]|uniref:efflux RND transporter permease subunit n=1 Tax=Lacinutrix jangbogonensis TaxID=1469557 RepID=UPI00053EC14A|nr:efflux RND transporter permease subunit [Lacinutrix jangbogonensis]
MNLTKFSIEKNRITYMALTTIMLLGVFLYQSLPRDSMPPITIRVATIVSQFPGAGPERVEELVTDKIEKVVQEIPELKEVTSTSRTGLSVINVTLKDEVTPEKLQSVWDRLRRKLDVIEGLPANVKPNLDDEGIGDVYGIVLGITSDGFSYAEMKEYVDDIKDDLIKLDAAAKVEIGGEQDERVFVEFDDSRLKEYGLSAQKLSGIISAQNILSSGGQINVEDERIILEPTGNFDTLSDIGDMLIPVGDSGQLVYLKDITTIEKGYISPATQKVLVNGMDAISLHISLKDNANIIALGEEVNSVKQKWEALLPVGLELRSLSSMDIYIEDKVSAFMVNLMQSVIIVLVVMLLFLGFRTGLIITSLIPIVIVTTFMVMGIMNIGINQVSLAALIMALGMMVDNGIVVAETIVVKLEEGIGRKEAAIQACSELFTPLLISTLTTAVAFMAFYLAESAMGDIVGPIFLVITIALVSSWLISLTIITLLSYLFMKAKPKDAKISLIDKAIEWLKGYYKDFILIALRHKVKTMLFIMVMFIVALFGFTKIEFLFFPDSDRNMITVDINLPLGTKIERTTQVVADIEVFIAKTLQTSNTKKEGIDNWSSYIGKGPESYDQGYSQDEANSSYAHILVNTSHFKANQDMINQLDAFCFDSFPNAEIKIGALAGGGGGTPIEIKVTGHSPDELSVIAEQVKLKLTSISGTKNVKDDWGPKTKKFIIDINQIRAQTAGVSSQDIATSLQTVLDGFITGEFREDDKSIPIVMRSDKSQEQTLESIETLTIFSQTTGKNVPLLQVASIKPVWQYAKIKRLDINRTVTISSELRENGNASIITAEIVPWLNEQATNWNSGYSYKLGGDAENTADNMGAVLKYLPLCGFIIMLLLIIQFNSFRKMIMVYCTIPLAIIGVVIGLLVFKEPFGFMPFLGVIALAGIIINNAIVLIDRMEIEQNVLKRKEEDSVITACLQRFRPILLATFTTVLGLIPLYLTGGEMWQGMAVSIMVGLLFGTVITLFFIPTFYSLLFKLNYKGYEFNNDLLD